MPPALLHRTRLQHMQSTTSPSDFRKNFALALLEEKPEWVSQVFGARLGPPMKRWKSTVQILCDTRRLQRIS